MEEWNLKKIHKFCIQRRMKWLFSPPSASPMGSLWESLISRQNKASRAILKLQLVSDEVLQTVMAEKTQILNSRPLTRNSDSPRDENPLTPNHLLHLRPTLSLPPGVIDNYDVSVRRVENKRNILQTFSGVGGLRNIYQPCWSERNGLPRRET